MFLGHFWALVRQPHDHIGWATSMSFAPINSTNQRTNPWNFHKTILRIGDFAKPSFFESAILDFFFLNFCLIPMKISQSFLCIKDGSKFWWIPWFPAKNHPHKTFLPPVYMFIFCESVASMYIIRVQASNFFMHELNQVGFWTTPATSRLERSRGVRGEVGYAD